MVRLLIFLCVIGVLFLAGCTESDASLQSQISDLQKRVAALEDQLNQANTLQNRVVAIETELDWNDGDWRWNPLFFFCKPPCTPAPNKPDLNRIDKLEDFVWDKLGKY